VPVNGNSPGAVPQLTIEDALRRAIRAYNREAAAHPEEGLGPGDWYRPFDIAHRAIELMFPGIQEEDIELPEWEFPRLPTPRQVVLYHLEMTGASAPDGKSRKAHVRGLACNAQPVRRSASPNVHRRSKNALNKRTLSVRVCLLREPHREIPLQVVIGLRRFRMSTKVVAKRELPNPKRASRDDTMEMKCTWSQSRLAEIPSLRKLLFVFLDVLVTCRLEC
jgi:hypothetical protein